MTDAAFDWLKFLIMRKVVEVSKIHVAVNTLQISMYGVLENIQMDFHRNFSAVAFAGEIRVLVTGHAVISLLSQ